MAAIRPVKLICVILALVTFMMATFFFQKYSIEIIHWVNQLGWIAPLLFLLLYCLATIMLLPTMVLTLAGGAIFGPVLGTLLNLLGATWGAACSFLITRHLIADWLFKRKGARINKLIYDVEQKGWLLIAVLRLFPILPFNLVNYGLGITKIKFRTYFITTLIFLIPPEIIYTYFGYAGMDVLLKQGNFYRDGGIIISGIAIIILCFCKFGLLNRSKFRHKDSTQSGF